LLQISGAGFISFLLAATGLPKAAEGSIESGETSQTLIEQYNAYLAQKNPPRSIIPFQDSADNPDFDKTIDSLILWSGFADSAGMNFSSVHQVFNWEQKLGMPFVRFVGKIPFPDNTVDGVTHSYTFFPDEETSVLSINGSPQALGLEYNGNISKIMKNLWPEGITLPPDLAEVMHICKSNHNPEIGIVTTDDIFFFHEKAHLYAKAEAQLDKTISIADAFITDNFQHNLLTLSTMNFFLHPDRQITQMYHDNMWSFITERDEALRRGEPLSPQIVYVPYPIEGMKDILLSEEIDFENLQLMFIHAAGNKSGDTHQARPLPPHVLCAGSLVDSGLNNPRVDMRQTLVPPKISNGNYYLVPNRIPGLTMQAGLTHDPASNALHMDYLVKPTVSAATSGASLFLTALTTVAASRVLSLGGTFNSYDIKSELNLMMKRYEFRQKDTDYWAYVPDIEAIRQQFPQPVRTHLPQIFQNGSEFIGTISGTDEQLKKFTMLSQV